MERFPLSAEFLSAVLQSSGQNSHGLGGSLIYMDNIMNLSDGTVHTGGGCDSLSCGPCSTEELELPLCPVDHIKEEVIVNSPGSSLPEDAQGCLIPLVVLESCSSSRLCLLVVKCANS